MVRWKYVKVTGAVLLLEVEAVLLKWLLLKKQQLVG